MVKDPAGPGASTIAVLCKDINKPEEFQEKYKIVYKYEVLGGLHTYLAKLQLTQEFPESSFYKYANADVYVGLSDEQALRLAQRHNQVAHLIHKITHRDLVSYHTILSYVDIASLCKCFLMLSLALVVNCKSGSHSLAFLLIDLSMKSFTIALLYR